MTGSSPPPSILDLATVVRQGERYAVDVMGVVQDFLPPSQTRGTDYQITFTIRDDSMLANGMRVKIFRPHLNHLPQIREIGDVVLLQSLRVSGSMVHWMLQRLHSQDSIVHE